MTCQPSTFLFYTFLQNSLQKSFLIIFLVFYEFSKMKEKKSIRNYEKDNPWNIRYLVESHLSKQTSEPAYYIVDCRIFGSLATVPSHKKLFDKFSRSNYLQLLWKLWQLHLLMPMEKSRCVEIFFSRSIIVLMQLCFQPSEIVNVQVWFQDTVFQFPCISREILGVWN